MGEATDRDVKQIEQVLYLYAWMVDKREWGLVDEVFSQEATIDYASTGGPGRLPYREALEWLDGALKPWPINLHHITNIMPQVDGRPGSLSLLLLRPHGPSQGRRRLLRARHRHKCRLLSRQVGAHGARLEDQRARL